MRRDGWGSFNDLDKLISKNYGLKIYRSELIRKIIKLTTNQGVKALKLVNIPYSRYIFTCEVMEHARNNGFYNIPEVLPSLDGKKGIETKEGIIMINDWVNAEEVKYSSDLQLKQTTVALAQLHRASERFKPSKNTKPKILWGKWIKNFNCRCKQMLMFKKIAESKSKKSDFDNKVIEFTDYFYDRGMKAIHGLEKDNYSRVSEKIKKKRTFCHHDLGHQNVLFTQDNDIYFIDFDDCILDMTIHDLANFIIRNVRYKPLNMDKVRFILKTYDKENSVSEQEMRIMRDFITFPQEFWELEVRYYKYPEKYPWPEEEFNMKLNRVINDIPTMEVCVNKF
ncbi:MAG: hypothetical protein PWP27_489 [Clostridiales bacterium]|nr:hypothetical protein [Clostridiales bacterium]MDK2932679.1 hypothetical protein [Clostridiales bacterium]